jgi:hypothetical protein
MTDLQKARDAATELEDAFNKECDRVYGNAKLWPTKTADALMSARLYANRVRAFLGATDDPDSEAVAEASSMPTIPTSRSPSHRCRGCCDGRAGFAGRASRGTR